MSSRVRVLEETIMADLYEVDLYGWSLTMRAHTAIGMLLGLCTILGCRQEVMRYSRHWAMRMTGSGYTSGSYSVEFRDQHDSASRGLSTLKVRRIHSSWIHAWMRVECYSSRGVVLSRFYADTLGTAIKLSPGFYTVTACNHPNEQCISADIAIPENALVVLSMEPPISWVY